MILTLFQPLEYTSILNPTLLVCRNVGPLVLLKNSKKHLWESVIFGKFAGRKIFMFWKEDSSTKSLRPYIILLEYLNMKPLMFLIWKEYFHLKQVTNFSQSNHGGAFHLLCLVNDICHVSVTLLKISHFTGTIRGVVSTPSNI